MLLAPRTGDLVLDKRARYGLTVAQIRRLKRRRLEEENARTGGTALGSIQPRRLSAYDMGRERAEMEQGYAAGRNASRAGAPAPAAKPPMPSASLGSTTGPADAAPFGDATAPSTPALAAGGANVSPRRFGPPQKLTGRVAPGATATARGSYVGAGGRYAAEFGTDRSAREFADFASRATDEDPGDQNVEYLRTNQSKPRRYASR